MKNIILKMVMSMTINIYDALPIMRMLLNKLFLNNFLQILINTNKIFKLNLTYIINKVNCILALKPCKITYFLIYFV